MVAGEHVAGHAVQLSQADKSLKMAIPSEITPVSINRMPAPIAKAALLGKRGSNVLLYTFAAFVFTLPWDNALVIPNFGTLSKLLGMLNIYFLLIAIFLKKVSFQKGLPAFIFWAGSFFLWSLATMLWSSDPEATLITNVTAFQSFLVLWLCWQYCAFNNGWATIALAYVLGCCIAIALAIHFTFFESALARSVRDIGALHPNGMAITIGLSIPLWWSLLRERSTTRFRQVIFYLYYPLVAFGILLSGSRSGLLVFVVCSSTLLVGKKKPGHIALVVFLLSLSIILIYSQLVKENLTLQWRFDRLGDFWSEIDITNQSRPYIWQQGLKIFQSSTQNVILGVGNGAFLSEYEKFVYNSKAAHNVFVALFVQTGVIGGILYFMIFISAYFFLKNSCVSDNKWRAWIFLAGLLLGMSTSNMEYDKTTWFIVGWIVGTAHIRGRGNQFESNAKQSILYR